MDTGKLWPSLCSDIFTVTNFSIAMIAAMIGHAVFHYLRKRL